MELITTCDTVTDINLEKLQRIKAVCNLHKKDPISLIILNIIEAKWCFILKKNWYNVFTKFEKENVRNGNFEKDGRNS